MDAFELDTVTRFISFILNPRALGLPYYYIPAWFKPYVNAT
jgi:hypothetical protein